MMLIVPTFIGISLITFLVIQLAPGSPVYLKLRKGESALASDTVSQQIIEQTKKLYGLDKPIHVRYILWVGKLIRLDFGSSYKDQRPVRDKILETIPVTLQIEIIVVFLVYLISIPVGVYSATHQRSWTDYAITVVLFILYSLPSFWVAMLLILFLGGGQFWNWFPINGLNSFGAQTYPWYAWLADRLWHLALPVFCLTYGGLAGLSRYARAGMIEVIRQDYIRTARAKGLSQQAVLYKHALRNAALPFVTILGLDIPFLLGGALVTESVYAWPGMGRLFWEYAQRGDYPVVLGVLLIVSVAVVFFSIVTDIIYTFVDPRIRLS